MNKGTLILTLLGIILFLLLFPALDLSKIPSYVNRIGLLPVVISIVLINIGVFFYSLGWYLISGRKISLIDSFLISYSALFMNLLIPTGSTSGEALRVYLAGKTGKMGNSEALSTVIAHRIVMTIPFLVCIALGVSSLSKLAGNLFLPSLMAITLISIGTLLIVKISVTEEYLMRILSLIERVTRRNMEKMRKEIKEYAETFKNLMNEKRRLAESTACSFANWLLDMAPIFIYLRSLGIEIDLFSGAFIYSFSILMVLIPLGIPGNTGVREWAMASLLMAMGVEKNAAIFVTIISSTITVFLNELLFGFICYIIALKRLGK
jgi:uncharacterized protein (TIRG00374 family)